MGQVRVQGTGERTGERQVKGKVRGQGGRGVGKYEETCK